MTREEIKNIMIKEIKARGYDYELSMSESTESVYIELICGKTRLLFRLSDHFTKKDIITLRFDMCKTKKDVIKFLQNRIRDLQDRSRKNGLWATL